MRWLLALLLPALLRGSQSESCEFNEVSVPVASLLCAVNQGFASLIKLSFPSDTEYCLLGKGKCIVRRVPTAADVKKAKVLPVADHKGYQALALIAEKAVPITWWREAFDDPALLLTPKGDHLPKPLLMRSTDAPNKKLKNLVNCLARQTVIRTGFANDTAPVTGRKKKNACLAREDATIRAFGKLWAADAGRLGGAVDGAAGRGRWSVDMEDAHTQQLYQLADKAMDYFLAHGGRIWTGCIRVAEDGYCKGALSAAVLLKAVRTLSLLASSTRSVDELGTLITEGYMYASIGRSLLHGSSLPSHSKLTVWNVCLSDFTAMQFTFLKLYMETFGKQYTRQLHDYVPMAFGPSFSTATKPEWKDYATRIEPVYSSLRNWMFTEARNLIDFGPYHPLVAFPEARQIILKTKKRRVLIDIGANGFLASPKYLIDSYAVFLPFTHVIMVEPEPHFSATVPTSYSSRYNITFLQIYIEVATGSKTDIVSLLPTLVNKDDLVVLKFDVDPNRFAKGPTMEWGFLFDLMRSPKVAALVDEIYIELHFHFPELDWAHYHSNWEGLDVFRALRELGIVVHCWP